MPKSSEEQAQARRDEIVNACAELYETMSFRDITLKEIGQRTSFTRTSIYNYFETREEIFLALTQREYEAWTADLNALAAREEPLTAEEFASALARTLERRSRLLKLMAMNLYDMEANTRLENLVAFKKAYYGAIRALAGCLRRFFPQMSAVHVRHLPLHLGDGQAAGGHAPGASGLPRLFGLRADPHFCGKAAGPLSPRISTKNRPRTSLEVRGRSVFT